MGLPPTSTDTAVATEAHEFLLKFHAAGDKLDALPYINSFYAEDAVLKFGNEEPLKGRQAIINFFNMQFALLESMKHEVTSIDVVGDKLYQGSYITYIIKGDPKKVPISVPGFAIFHRNPAKDGGKLKEFEVFLDPTPLVKHAAVVAAARQ